PAARRSLTLCFCAGDLHKLRIVVRREPGVASGIAVHWARRPRDKMNMRHGGAAMFEILDRRTSLTGNQIKILTAAIIGDALEFFDYFLIGFVLAFLIGPWKLTFGQ